MSQCYTLPKLATLAQRVRRAGLATACEAQAFSSILSRGTFSASGTSSRCISILDWLIKRSALRVSTIPVRSACKWPKRHKVRQHHAVVQMTDSIA